MASFDIRQLRYAIAAADHGSFYRAARALDVEQSTLSRNILGLERIVGAKLFERSRAGVKVTIAGIRFIHSARSMVATAERMLATTRMAGQGRAGSLVIGFNSSLSAGNLRATMLAWQTEHPDVDVEAAETDRGALLAGLDRGEIDIAILMGEAGHNGFRREPFWSERVLIALPVGHLLAEREVVLWTDLRSEPFILSALDPGLDLRDMIGARLAMLGAQPDIKMTQTSRETVLSLLGTGRRLSIVCEGSIGARYPDVIYRAVHGEQGPALVSYSGYWRNDNANPPLKRFLTFVRHRFALSFEIMTGGADSGSSLLEIQSP